jgi:methylated-DNA-[protein]-cysteine S-methyltransferase
MPHTSEVAMPDSSHLATVVQTARGWVALARTERGLRRCHHSADTRAEAEEALGAGWTFVEPDADPLLKRAADLVSAHLAGRRVIFDLPLDLSGLPDFTRRVLLACHRIPPGETRSYGELAREVGSPGAARAVGQAMRRNPMGLIVPCHRVVGSDGSLTGFAGKSCALELKASLLELERNAVA